MRGNSAMSAGFLLLFAVLAGAPADLRAADAAPVAAQSSEAPEPGPPALIPIRAFATMPTMSDPVLSPDGRAVVTRIRKNGQEFLLIHGLFAGSAGSGQERSVLPVGKASVNWVRWANDAYVVASVRQKTEVSGKEFPYDRLVLFSRNGEALRSLGPPGAGPRADDVIFWANDGSYLLLSAGRGLIDAPSVYRVDIPSNNVAVLEMPRYGILRWVANSAGDVVAGIGFADLRHLQVIYRSQVSQPFETVLRVKFGDDGIEDLPLNIAHIDDRTQKGYVVSRRGGDRWGLYEYDFGTRSPGAAVFSHDVVDLDDFGFDGEGHLKWASYVDDRRRYKWFEDEDKEFYASLEKAVPDKVAYVVGESRDKTIRLVRTSSPTDPGSFYVYAAQSGKMTLIASTNDELRRASLSPTQYVSFTARDGLVIPAYLTLPGGRSPASLPLIVLPHGGPFVRDEWDYEFIVQYLSNRGYAVLQPNFRGSTGYGRAFEEKGFQQLGKAMQDDLDDGVRWLVGAGKVDPKRVCIVGWSYGGYAAQVAAFRNPDIYRCAASIAGISDLAAMLKYDSRFMFGANYRKWRARLTDSGSNSGLRAVSSLQQVKSVSIPLLLVHGTDDDIVPVVQSDKLVAKLKKAGKPHEYLRIEDGDHSLLEESQRMELLAALDRFLATYNPTDVLKSGSSPATAP